MKKRNRKSNKKGFTLIELLAVITIMGILMLVAIPAVSRTIENTRRDTFASTAKSYIKAIKDEIAADNIYTDNGETPISAAPAGYYYYSFSTKTIENGINSESATDLMEQGGKSSWGNADVMGFIVVDKTVDATKGNTKYEYYILMVDSGQRGIETVTKETAIKRGTVKTKDAAKGRQVLYVPLATGEKPDKIGEDILNPGEGGNCKSLSLG